MSSPQQQLNGKRSPESQEGLLNLEQVAALLKISPASVLNMAERGQLSGTRTIGEWRFPRVFIEKWQQEQAKRTQRDVQRSAVQKLQGLERPSLLTSTESYDLSFIGELDIPDL